MAVDDEAKYFPHKVAWLTLNKLDEFDKHPKLIEDLADKFEHLTSHTIYHKFAPLYREAVNYYNEHGKFPDLPYLNSRFPEGKVIEYITGIQYSITLYDKLRKQLDYEIIIQDFNEHIGYSEFIDMQSCMDFSKKLAEFANTNSEIPLDTKEDWINSYKNAIKDYHGISTGIKQVDEKIGAFSNLVTIAAPSGNGKSTFALSLAYNMATYRHPRMGRGANVLYISFEMSKFELQANLASIESSFSENHSERIRATDIKERNLDENSAYLYEKHINNFTQRLNYSGGYVALVDNTSMTGYNSIEGFMASIEELSEKLDRKFDIIFIDNVDSLKVLKGDRGQDEMAKMNSFITKLDAFTKTYADNYGTTIVLLSQTNRDGYKKLKAMEASGTQEITIDYTVLQQYSALYERATMVLVLYSSALMRANNQLKLMPVKLRNKSLPHQPFTLVTRWDYSYVGGTYKPPKITEDDINEIIEGITEADYSDEEELMNSMDTVREDVEDIENFFEEEGDNDEELDIPDLGT